LTIRCGDTERARWRSALAVCLLGAVVGIVLFVNSPWHHDEALPGQLCPFFQFEHPSVDGLPATPVIPPPLWTAAARFEPETVLPPSTARAPRRGRAPPTEA